MYTPTKGKEPECFGKELTPPKHTDHIFLTAKITGTFKHMHLKYIVRK